MRSYSLECTKLKGEWWGFDAVCPMAIILLYGVFELAWNLTKEVNKFDSLTSESPI